MPGVVANLARSERYGCVHLGWMEFFAGKASEAATRGEMEPTEVTRSSPQTQYCQGGSGFRHPHPHFRHFKLASDGEFDYKHTTTMRGQWAAVACAGVEITYEGLV